LRAFRFSEAAPVRAKRRSLFQEIIYEQNKTVTGVSVGIGAGLMGGAITERMNYTFERRRSDPTAHSLGILLAQRAAVGVSRGGLYSITYFRDGGAQVVEAKSWLPNVMARPKRSHSWARTVGKWLVRARSR